MKMTFGGGLKTRHMQGDPLCQRFLFGLGSASMVSLEDSSFEVQLPFMLDGAYYTKC